jgi:hypothetical protein
MDMSPVWSLDVALRRQGVYLEQVFRDEIHDFLLHRDWVTAYTPGADFLNRKQAAKHESESPKSLLADLGPSHVPAGERFYFAGVNSSSRTCQVTDSPGFRVTIPVSMPFHSLPKGSPKLNCSSMATNCLVGGA